MNNSNYHVALGIIVSAADGGSLVLGDYCDGDLIRVGAIKRLGEAGVVALAERVVAELEQKADRK